MLLSRLVVWRRAGARVAQILHGRGYDIPGVLMIDSPCPVGSDPLPKSVVDYVYRSKGISKSAAPVIAAQFAHHTRFLCENMQRCTVARGTKYLMLQSSDTIDTIRLCGTKFPWLADQESRRAALAQWEDIIRQSLSVLPIPGNHFEPFDDQNVSSPTLLSVCMCVLKRSWGSFTDRCLIATATSGILDSD
jgi:hypothetical protein